MLNSFLPLDESVNDPTPLFYTTLSNVIKHWSDPFFISNASKSLETHLTLSNLSFLSVLTRQNTDLSIEQKFIDHLHSDLLTGIEIRFESQSKNQTENGLHVAQMFSKIVRPKEPISFDEIKDSNISKINSEFNVFYNSDNLCSSIIDNDNNDKIRSTNGTCKTRSNNSNNYF